MNKIYAPDKDYFFEIRVNDPIVDSVDGTEESPDVLAQVSPYRRLALGDDGEFHIVKGCMGLIQFKNKKQFNAFIISHEAVHCATAYCRYFEPEALELSSEDIDENEERFADIVCHFVEQITDYYYDVLIGEKATNQVKELLDITESAKS
jgi:hypothetical protein